MSFDYEVRARYAQEVRSSGKVKFDTSYMKNSTYHITMNNSVCNIVVKDSSGVMKEESISVHDLKGFVEALEFVGYEEV